MKRLRGRWRGVVKATAIRLGSGGRWGQRGGASVWAGKPPKAAQSCPHLHLVMNVNIHTILLFFYLILLK